MTTHVTPEEAAQYARERIEQHTQSIVQLLSLQPEDSPVHNVEAYQNGLRIPVQLTDYYVYVYCLPWARGWSIFASPIATDVASYSWRTVPLRWRKYQVPCYNPRDTIGPWYTPAKQIVAALEYVTRRVGRVR